MRYSLKCITLKDRKAFTADLKSIYTSPTREAAETALLQLSEHWSDKYALAVRGLQIARRSVDNFGALLAAGITIWIAIKALLNIAVMVALVPLTGASLPFISFGGSSLVVVMAGTGLLLSVARVRARQNVPKRAAPLTDRSPKVTLPGRERAVARRSAQVQEK